MSIAQKRRIEAMIREEVRSLNAALEAELARLKRLHGEEEAERLVRVAMTEVRAEGEDER